MQEWQRIAAGMCLVLTVLTFVYVAFDFSRYWFLIVIVVVDFLVLRTIKQSRAPRN